MMIQRNRDLNDRGMEMCISGDSFDSHILLEAVVHDCNRVMI